MLILSFQIKHKFLPKMWFVFLHLSLLPVQIIWTEAIFWYLPMPGQLLGKEFKGLYYSRNLYWNWRISCSQFIQEAIIFEDDLRFDWRSFKEKTVHFCFCCCCCWYYGVFTFIWAVAGHIRWTYYGFKAKKT